MGISFLFFGPSPLTGFKEYTDVWRIYLSIGTMTFFFAFAMVPCYERITAYATYGLPEANNKALMTTVGVFFIVAMTLGDFISASLSGSLSDAFGFSLLRNACPNSLMFWNKRK